METERICPSCRRPLAADAPQGLCPECLMQAGFGTGVAPEPGQPTSQPSFTPPPLAEVAKLFPQLEIVELLGRGGMGAVYKARQPALDRWVALKILPPQSTARPGFADRFNREARALARLGHANIVAVYEFGQAGSMPYFVMEYVEGVTLRRLVQERRLSPREALRIVPQICEALQFAHDEGVVHRDIKPENILLDKKGRVKIADFGIAKIVTGEQPEKTITQDQVIGTPHYMAPEQVEHPQTVDHRADIYSLGVVFYEMLTGELPLGKFQPPSKKVQVDVRLDEVVLHTLAKEPERRYQHASQVKTDVETIASTASPPQPNTEAFTGEILARDYTLDMGSCLRRGWALVRSDSWPIVGITALIFTLWAIAGSIGGSVVHSSSGATVSRTTSALAILVWGPLMGGLYLHFVKKIRGERTSIETAFSGFSNRFLHLLLGNFVASTLMALGFLCLILPGIYLMVAWMFILPLIIDKGLDFWPAMELSRRMVSKHWWKCLGFGIVLALLAFAGVLACGFGLLITLPIALAALMYAYEDIFGPASGGVNRPFSAAPQPPTPRPDRFWRRFAVVVALVMIAIPVGAILLLATVRYARQRATVTAYDPGRVGAVEQKLTRAVEDRLRAADYRFDSVFVNVVSAKYDQVECLIEGLQRGVKANVFEAVTGKLVVQHVGNGLWSFTGTGGLSQMKSHVDASAEMGPLQAQATDTLFRYPEAEAADSNVPAAFEVTPGFGPVFERWVNGYGAEAGRQGLNFRTTALFSIPERQLTNNEMRMKWVMARNIDLLVVNKGGFKWNLVGPDLKVVRLSEADWDQATPQELRRALATVEMETEDGWPFYAINDRLEKPLTFAVHSGSGVDGLLQLTGYTERPRGVKIRYKLVEKASSDPKAGVAQPLSAMVPNTDQSQEHIAAMNQMDWRKALALAKKVAALPPEEGWAVVRDHWTTVTNAESRKQFLKAFVFANHPRTLGVLHLGLQDPSPAVQNWALGYLKDIALHDFADDFAAAQAWVGARKDQSLDEVMKASARKAATLLKDGGTDAVHSLLTVLSMPTELRDHPNAVQESGLDKALEGIINGPDESLVILALKATLHFKLSEAWCRRVLLPRLSSSQSVETRAYAAIALGNCGGDWAVDPLLNAMTNRLADMSSRAGPLSEFASALAEIKSARAIPTMIAIIEADNTYNTVYGVGYFGLGKLTGVSYDEKHDGAWWRAWWEKNKQRFPAEVQVLEIPRLEPVKRSPRAKADKAEAADVADVPAEQHFANGDTNKLYFLIGRTNDAVSSRTGHRLLLVLPGGDGGPEFQPFIKRICKNALPEGYLIAQLVAPKWDEQQFAQLVWPTETNRYPAMKFSTEEFVRAVVGDIENEHRLDTNRIFSLSWSSGGPAGYAISLDPTTRVTGSLVAMSVFKPAELPDLKPAQGRAYYLLHSPEDFIPLRMAEQARDTLKQHGAVVQLQTYSGGHGWRGDVFGLICQGVEWLEQQPRG